MLLGFLAAQKKCYLATDAELKKFYIVEPAGILYNAGSFPDCFTGKPDYISPLTASVIWGFHPEMRPGELFLTNLHKNFEY